MKKKLTICNVITGLSTGGAEMMLLKIINGMDKDIFNPIVISLSDKGIIGGKIENLGVKVYSLNFRRFSDLPKVIKNFSVILKKHKPDIIQGWMYHGNLFALLGLFYSFKIPILWNIRGSHFILNKVKKSTALIIKLGAKLSFVPEKIINNSTHSAEKHTEILGYKKNKTYIIPNGFNIDMFKPSIIYRKKFRDEMGINDDSILVGLIGRFNLVKGHDLFIEAANQLVKNEQLKEKIKFILIGNKVDCSNSLLYNHIKKYGLEEYFYLLGEKGDLQNIIPALDLVVSSSYSEGFPNVIGEAMSCGLPCVVTNVGDSGFVVGDTGVIVPAKNIEALTRGIEFIVNMPKSEREILGMSARQRIIDNFSIESVVKKYSDLYEEIINK